MKTQCNCTLRYTDMVSSLAGVGEDPNQLTEYGEAPLCVAAHKAQGLVVAELLARDNIDPNIKVVLQKVPSEGS